MCLDELCFCIAHLNWRGWLSLIAHGLCQEAVVVSNIIFIHELVHELSNNFNHFCRSLTWIFFWPQTSHLASWQRSDKKRNFSEDQNIMQMSPHAFRRRETLWLVQRNHMPKRCITSLLKLTWHKISYNQLCRCAN